MAKEEQGLYLIRNLSNDKFYIGSSIRLITRIKQHGMDLRRNDHSNPWLQRAFNNGHKLQVLLIPVMDGVNIREIEQKAIEQAKQTNAIYNVAVDTRTPMLGRKHSEEALKKLSEAHKGFKHSDESKERMSNAHKGKSFSDEFKEKCRQRMLGHTPSEETRKRLSDAGKGRIMTKETRDKLSDINKGKVISDEAKEKIHQANLRLAKPVIIDGILYESRLDASNKTGIPLTTLCKRIKRGVYTNA